MTQIRYAILAAVAVLSVAFGATAQTPATYFPLPVVPDSISTLSGRANFMMQNYWKHCNLKSAFSSLDKMRGAFDSYAGLMPYATASEVHTSIEALIKEVNKNPKNMLSLAEMAEGAFYSDTSSITCDECYLPFAKAVADNSKISKAEKARFEYQANILEHSQVGMKAPDFAYVTPEGEQKRFAEIEEGPYVLLFFNNPDCDECELARVRLAADYNLNELIRSGKIVVVSILPSEPTDEWRDRASLYSKKWVVGASGDIDGLYDLRQTPAIYYLNGTHNILSKTFNIDNLIEAFARVNRKLKGEN